MPKNFTVTHLTSLQNKITSHKSLQFTSHHYTSHLFTYLHSTSISVPFLVTTFLTLFLNVFRLQGKGATKLAGNWFQRLMVLLTKEYLLTPVLCFLVIIFRLWSSLLIIIIKISSCVLVCPVHRQTTNYRHRTTLCIGVPSQQTNDQLQTPHDTVCWCAQSTDKRPTTDTAWHSVLVCPINRQTTNYTHRTT